MKDRKTQTGTATRDSTDRLLSRLLEEEKFGLFYFCFCLGSVGDIGARGTPLGCPPPQNDGPEIRV